jgi:HEPN domain-containing protein
MNVPPDVLQVVGEWVRKAEHDLTVARHTLKLGAAAPAEIVCFHAQQCVEKYLKALLTWRGLDFPKTHDIEVLNDRLPAALRLGLSPIEQRTLTHYAVASRYPDMDEPIPLTAAKRAVGTARQVRKHLRKFLPKDALGAQ